MSYRATDGSILTASIEFMDDSGNPIIPANGWPRAALLDHDKDVVVEAVGVPNAVVGKWDVSLALPKFGLEAESEYRLRWRLLDVDGQRWSETDVVVVEPVTQRRSSDVVVTDELIASVTIPTKCVSATYQVYQNNKPLLDAFTDVDDVVTSANKSALTFDVPDMEPSLQSCLLMIRAKSTYTFRMWKVTPQILLAMSHLDAFLNKSRLENVIPELEFVAGDMLGYLERGLYLFNTIHTTTAFTGTNMQGPLFDAWVTCSCYYALCSQLIAEGSLAFDFSGQGVSLNVDRTPQLDSALGRIESRISDLVTPLKKALANQAILGGDGSVGATSMKNYLSVGILSVINAPTTRYNGRTLYGRNRF